MDNKVNSFNLVSDVFLRYVFNLLKVEKFFSIAATETGRTVNNFKRLYILGNKFLSHLSREQIAVLDKSSNFDFKCMNVMSCNTYVFKKHCFWPSGFQVWLNIFAEYVATQTINVYILYVHIKLHKFM